MTDFDAFDQRLAGAFRSYAADAPTVDDPAAFARVIALEHPRRGTWRARPLVRTVGWVLVGAALILAALLGLAVIVGGRPPIDPLVVPRNPMPDELFGVRSAGGYSLDVNDTFLLRGQDGEPLEWAGTAVDFVPRIGEAGDLVVGAAAPCGEGRYSIRTDTPPVGQAPAPSASGGNPTPLPAVTPLDLVGQGRPFVLIPIVDACSDRLAILTSGEWAFERIELVADQRYDSMDFTEPFRFVMPEADPRVSPAVQHTTTKGVLRVGNGYSWSSYFYDDLPVFADACDPGGAIRPDIPQTPEEVGDWLRSSTGITVGSPVQVPVDGRTALLFEPRVREACRSFAPERGENSYRFGVPFYAIPTGDDTILYVVSSDGGDVPSDAVVADEIVRSMTFE